MKSSEYRENKITKYPDRETGTLMYKHEKIFDIVSTIEEFVKLSFDKEMNQKEYRDAYKRLIDILPEEYKKHNWHRFQNFMTTYHLAKNIDRKHKNNFRRGLYKHLKIEYINDIDDSMRKYLKESTANDKEINLQRYGWTVAVHLPTEKYQKLSPRSKWHYHYSTNGIFIDDSFPQDSKKQTLKHEHFHHMAHLGLMDNEKKHDKEWRTTPESYMRRRIKNEIIAQYSDEKNIDFKTNIDTGQVINRYIADYLGEKYGKDLLYKREIFYFPFNKVTSELSKEEESLYENDYKENWVKNLVVQHNIYVKIDGKYELCKDANILKDFENYNKEARLWTTMLSVFTALRFDKFVPKYFTSYDQILYLLAITPLSEWVYTIKYYEKLFKLDETKAELNAALTST